MVASLKPLFGWKAICIYLKITFQIYSSEWILHFNTYRIGCRLYLHPFYPLIYENVAFVMPDFIEGT